MANVTEPDELKLKKYEELYKFTKALYDSEIQRFDASETKVMRYLSVLIVILGIGAVVGIKELISIISDMKSAPAILSLFIQWVFVISYSGMYLTGFWSLWKLLSALRMRDAHRVPLDHTLVRHFDENRYIDVIFSFSKRFLEAAEHNRQRVKEKYQDALWGSRLLRAMLVLAVISITQVFHEGESMVPWPSDQIFMKGGTMQALERLKTHFRGYVWRHVLSILLGKCAKRW